MPRQLAWCKRPAEDGKMIVQLDLWARYAGKAARCGTSLLTKPIPSLDPRRVYATSFDAHTQGWFDSNFRRDRDGLLVHGAKACCA